MQFKGKLTIITADKDDSIEVTISDTGIGIAPEIINKSLNLSLQQNLLVKEVGWGCIFQNRLSKNIRIIEVSSSKGWVTTFLIIIPK
jgi:sensor histidine kinase regulating citrate/malate metabolism